MHSVHSEPYYYDTAYLHCFQPTRLRIDKANLCFYTENMMPNSESFVCSAPIPLDAQGVAHISEGSMCSYTCCTVSDDDVKVIIDLKRAFENPITQIREELQNIDHGCPHVHHVKPRRMDDWLACTEISKLGHPLPCSSGMCNSKLRVLRAASVHYPGLRKLLHSVYMARKCHSTVAAIDSALSSFDHKLLCELVQVQDYINLIGEVVEGQDSECDLPSSENMEFSAEGLVGIERDIQIKHASTFETHKKKLDENPIYPCCSCERLHNRNNVTQFTSKTEKFSSDTWKRLKQYVSDRDENFNSKTYYVCTHCRPLLNKNKLPSRCVLNGLYVEEILNELLKLNALGRQLIQRAKPFQTIIRLGTYTGKVPIYNATKGLKGTVFFLPLPLQNTIDKLDALGIPKDVLSESVDVLPDPELYILLDGRPTKDKVVWQSLVDVNDIKRAVKKLKETNWLYKNIDENRVDDAAKNTIEVVSSTTSSLIEKCSNADIAELDAYTIRNMDEKLPLGSDIEHFKMLKVEELALDNRLKFLDVLWKVR